MIQLNEQIIENLSSRGVLAYIAVSLAGSGIYSSATLALRVNSTTGAMRAGMEELAVHHPGVVQWRSEDKKWIVGFDGGDNLVQALVEKDQRRANLVDDLKRYWDYLNPNLRFSFTAKDGSAVAYFLRNHAQWLREDWIRCLHNRCMSDINRSEPFYKWMSKLEEYAAGPLDRYMKPKETGGKHGEAISRETANRLAAREAAADRV